MAIQLPHINLGPRTRKIVRYTGFTLLALVVFVIALQLSFPYDRVKDKLIEASADKSIPLPEPRAVTIEVVALVDVMSIRTAAGRLP